MFVLRLVASCALCAAALACLGVTKVDPPVAPDYDGNARLRALINCDFENDDLCSYTTEGHRAVPAETRNNENEFFLARRQRREENPKSLAWVPWRGRFGNPVTGVLRAGQGDYFGGAYLLQTEFAVLETEVNTERDVDIEFSYYEATYLVSLSFCCDDTENCNFETADAREQRGWKSGLGYCPAGTRKILFFCKNGDSLQGACGVDDIRLVE